MSLKAKLQDDLKEAMRSKDKTRLAAIRMLRAAVLEREKSGEGEVAEEDIIAIVQKQAKQRRDAIEQFEAAGRDDLAKQETQELAVIKQYLPPQMTDEELSSAVREIVTRTGAEGMKDMGRVMGQAMQQLRGKADGRRVKEAVEAVLKS
ncbi:MAG: GatB/YqeY domain-containing protein [Rubricoccaceae bacterium]|nr:GatB/YqeY domain-containing protein [Rubricoccaceae bacterium]